MSQIWNINEATDRLFELVERAARGEEFVIAHSGRPMPKLVPIEPKPRGRVNLGIARGEIWIAPDFDEFPEDIQRAFEGERENLL